MFKKDELSIVLKKQASRSITWKSSKLGTRQEDCQLSKRENRGRDTAERKREDGLPPRNSTELKHRVKAEFTPEISEWCTMRKSSNRIHYLIK